MFEIRDGVPYVMERAVEWACAVHRWDGPDRPDDWPYEHWWVVRARGFHVLMENGLKLSTQFGSGNYCANHEPLMTQQDGEDHEFSERCPDAEVAAWWMPDKHEDENNMEEWPEGDKVFGWFPAEHWFALVEALSQIPTGRPIKPTVAALLRTVAIR